MNHSANNLNACMHACTIFLVAAHSHYALCYQICVVICGLSRYCRVKKLMMTACRYFTLVATLSDCHKGVQGFSLARL